MKANISKNFYIFFAVFGIIAFMVAGSYGCGNKNLIDQDKFVNIYTDMVIARDTVSVKDKTNEALKEEILKRYNVTGAEYKKTVSYYNENPKEWETFFKKVMAHVSQLKKKSGV